jgi:GMP synthase (glutamine-hydrolysing)
MDPAVLAAGVPILGICYGQQLIAHLLGGDVDQGDKGEFGLAYLDIQVRDSRLFAGLTDHQKIWMSHRDLVSVPPAGFRVLATTSTCSTAAMEDASRGIYAVQFHPEVVHTTEGVRILENFLFGICGCTKDWNPSNRLALVEDQIRERAGGRSVFFFVSGGLDSTVAFTLCLEALGSERVCGVYVDTGLMREGETGFVEETFAALGHGVVSIEHAEEEFLGPLEGVYDPELKRHIIGEQFVKVQ